MNDADLKAAPAPVPSGKAIRIGLGQVKHLIRKSAEAIVTSRRNGGRYRSMDDLLARVKLAVREAQALILSGACDGLPPLSPEVYPFVHEALVEGFKGRLDPVFFERSVRSARAAAQTGQLRRRYRVLARIRNELDHLEMHLAARPMRVLRPDAENHGCLTAAELRQRAYGAGRVHFAGIAAAGRVHPLGGGRMMRFLTLEDETGLMEAVIPPPAYLLLAARITTPGPYLAGGSVVQDRGHAYLLIEDLRPFHERA